MGAIAGLLGISSFRLYIYAALAGAFLVACGAAYWYWGYSQDKIVSLSNTVARQEYQINLLSQTLAKKELDIKEIQAANQQLSDVRGQNEASIASLNKLLDNLKFVGMGAVAAESEANKLAGEQRRCIEIATGSKPIVTDQGNRICPQLIPPPVPNEN